MYHNSFCEHGFLYKSKYNNGLIAKMVSISTDVVERREEREGSLALMQATSWVRSIGINGLR
jgi:hypothetical protein